jgi:hypothetical protein
MLPQTYLRLTSQYGTDSERDTGRTGHDTTPNHLAVWGVGELTRSLVIGGA